MTNNLDRGNRKRKLEDMRATTLKEDPSPTRIRGGHRFQANSLFHKILPATTPESIFCAPAPCPVGCNLKKTSTLPDRAQEQVFSVLGFAASKCAAKSLFGNILHVTPRESRFCKLAHASHRRNFKKTNILLNRHQIKMQPNSLFGNILHITPTESRFCVPLPCPIRCNLKKTEILSDQAQKNCMIPPHHVQAVREKSHLFCTEVVADENASREAGDRIQPTTQVVGRKWKNDEQPGGAKEKEAPCSAGLHNKQ